MSSSCAYNCAFCKITLKTEKGWLNHLIQSDHQTKARENIVSSWDLETKKRALVAFGKFSVASETVLAAFREQDGRSSLLGFVWNEMRPRVGFLLFESREKVNEVLKGLNEKSQMRISSYQLLQLKRATDYLDLEWEGLITNDFRSEFLDEMKTKVKTETDAELLPMSKRIKLAMSDSDDGSSDPEDDDKARVKVDPEELLPLPLPFIFNLSSQFDFLCLEIEIEDGAYTEALVIMEKLQRVISTKFSRSRIFMFRHWNLKLRAQGANELLLYFDADGILDSITGGDVSTTEKPHTKFLAELFVPSKGHDFVPAVWKWSVWDDRKDMNTYLGFEKESALHFKDTFTKTNFTLVTDPKFAVEVQTCRILNYLLDFDPRARPFLTLIFYWAEQNGVRISGRLSTTPIPNHLAHAFAPEPAGLEWMVIFFLCLKRILPTPREILDRAQCPKVWYFSAESPLNIGFRMDAQFAEEWTAFPNNCPTVGTNEFVLHLVEMSKEFFTFYGSLRTTAQHYVLNTRDGELLRKEDLLMSNPTEFATRLTKAELKQLRNSEEKLTKTHKTLNGLTNRRFAILHPLILQWTIFCNEDNFFGKICLEMLASARIIETELRDFGKTEEGETEDKKAIASLKSLFRKVTLKDIRQVAM